MWDNRSRYVDNHDGDTITYLSDLGRDVRHEADVRLLGVYAPELDEPGGLEVREFVAHWHAQRTGARRWPFLVVTSLVHADDVDRAAEKRTFTRYVATVTCLETGESLNAAVGAYCLDRGFSGGIGARLAA